MKLTRYPHVHWMPRAKQDVVECLAFVAKHSSGRPLARWHDIRQGIDRICLHPRLHGVVVRRTKSGVELRRHYAAQFVIIYTYLEPNAITPLGEVSIRAIRHRRVRNPFGGVKDAARQLYASVAIGGLTY